MSTDGKKQSNCPTGNATSSFDAVAKQYSESIDVIPPQFAILICRLFNLSRDDRIIDLGCGTGTLTLQLSNYCSGAEGLDSSAEMLRIAQEKDKNRSVRWHFADMNDFIFEENTYKLILSFESFHLFPTPSAQISKIYNALKNDGYLAIGWCRHFWEKTLQNVIVAIFSKYGVDWGNWDYQLFPDFENALHLSGVSFGPIESRSIKILCSVEISQIASYLACIAKAQQLSKPNREFLETELLNAFMDIYKSNSITGETEYGISYCQKPSRVSDK